MLPMLTYSLKDSLLINAFNLFFGLGVGERFSTWDYDCMRS